MNSVGQLPRFALFNTNSSHEGHRHHLGYKQHRATLFAHQGPGKYRQVCQPYIRQNNRAGQRKGIVHRKTVREPGQAPGRFDTVQPVYQTGYLPAEIWPYSIQAKQQGGRSRGQIDGAARGRKEIMPKRAPGNN